MVDRHGDSIGKDLPTRGEDGPTIGPARATRQGQAARWNESSLLAGEASTGPQRNSSAPIAAARAGSAVFLHIQSGACPGGWNLCGPPDYAESEPSRPLLLALSLRSRRTRRDRGPHNGDAPLGRASPVRSSLPERTASPAPPRQPARRFLGPFAEFLPPRLGMLREKKSGSRSRYRPQARVPPPPPPGIMRSLSAATERQQPATRRGLRIIGRSA